MRKLFGINIFCVVVAFPVLGFAEILSLRDLPAHWNGTVGDLVTRTTASLEIKSIDQVVKEEVKGHMVSAKYDVTAVIRFGERTSEIYHVHLSGDKSKNIFEITLKARDVLNPVFFLSLIKSADDTWTLKEFNLPQRENSRFVLTSQ